MSPPPCRSVRTICCNRFAIDGHAANYQATALHHWSCRSVGLLFTGNVTLWRFNWQTSVHLQFPAHTAHKTDRGSSFTSGTDFGAFRTQRSICCNASNCSCFPSQQSNNGSCSSPSHVFRNLPQNISIFLNQESGGNGGIISVVHVWIHHHPPPHRGLTIPRRTQHRWSPMAHFVKSLFLRPHNVQHFSLWAQIWVKFPIDVSFGSACSDVTNASTAETFSVNLPFPPPLPLLGS